MAARNGRGRPHLGRTDFGMSVPRNLSAIRYRVVPITTLCYLFLHENLPYPFNLEASEAIQAFVIKHFISCVRTRIKNELHKIMLRRAEKSRIRE